MRLVDEIFPLVEGFYVDLHRNPELSHQEHRTSQAVAEWLSRAGYEVTTGIGGTGVVGILRNGEGPTVLLRCAMDALPLAEQTGLPYASTARGTTADGQETPIMHAAGHDAHTACLVGTADLLSSSRKHWSGTLMVVAQPGQETLDGAEAMLADGLYERFGRPDIVLTQRVGPQPAGMIAHRAGVILGMSTTVGVRIFGSPGHGGFQPQTGVDPVVIAASIITRLQTIVACEVNPSEMAVLTTGVVRAGTKADLVPDEAYLEINTRCLNERVADRIYAAIERVVKAEAAASAAPREPEVTEIRRTSLIRNHAQHTRAVSSAHRAYFGDAYVIDLPEPFAVGDDFGAFGLPDDPEPVPYVMWLLGSTPHDVWSAAPGATPFDKLASVPGSHSSQFAPDREATLRAGIAALTIGALTYLGRTSGPGRATSGLAQIASSRITEDESTQSADMEALLADDDEGESTQSADMEALLADDDEGESTQSADMEALLADDDEGESTQSADMEALLADDDEGESTQSADMEALLADDEGETTQRANMAELLNDPPPPPRGPTQGPQTGPAPSFRPPSGPPLAAPPPMGPPVDAPPPPETPPHSDEPPYRY
ncbi:amidohydrolase [Thermobifida fusca]|uniref:amidohydrolase n=1 Tax=Thermobifida fusca TaxID=2021 RepID=UPI0022266619|nr:amidohydrolase [Thermobifida fusca]